MQKFSESGTLFKLFEKVVCSQFNDFLSRFKLLHGKQSGFRPKHSCQTSACRQFLTCTRSF
jgi:hypothetical protein